MEIQHIVTLVVLLAFDAVLFMVCWALALKTGNRNIQKIGMKMSMVFLIPIVMFGTVLFFNSMGPPDFETRVPGPASTAESALSEVRFPVTDSSASQTVALTMMAVGLAKGVGELKIHYRIQDPEGKELTTGEQIALPGEGTDWQPIRFQFQAEHTGDHKVLVDIPKGVDMMTVLVKEGQ
jgi:hypothetical protein